MAQVTLPTRSRTLRWEDYPGLFRWVQCNHGVPEERGRKSRGPKSGTTTEADVTEMWPQAKEHAHPLETRQSKGTDRYLEFPEGAQPCQHLGLAL